MAKQQKWKLEDYPRHVRAVVDGETVAESKRPMLMIESGYEIDYYFPQADLDMSRLQSSGEKKTSGYKGTQVFYNLVLEDRIIENAAWIYPDTPQNRPDLSAYVAFDWHKIDHWYEEDREIIGHPRNPYHRVDAFPSKRHIQIVVNGATIAESNNAHFLFETGFPTRYYLPQEDVNMDYLTPTGLSTICTYKGVSSYWTINVNGETHENVVWGYENPMPQQHEIKGLMAFYNEKLDVYVDGKLEEKPRTVFS